MVDSGKLEKFIAKNKVDKICKMMGCKDAETVLAGIDALGKCTGDEAFNALVPLLNSDDSKIRTHAVKALGQMGVERGKTFLMQRLEHEDDQNVKNAIAESVAKIKAGH